MDWLRRFMNGRYGIDHLYKALLLLSIAVTFIGIITDFELLNTVALAILIYAVFRVISRNTAARARENAAFLNWYNSLASKLNSRKNRLKDMKTHRFLKCPQCNQTLRVPKGKGRIRITCPKCITKFEART